MAEKAEQAQEKVKEVAGQAQERAQEVGQQARGRVREQVDQRSTQAGQQVRSTAGDARSVAEELRRQGKAAPARYMEQAADRAERVGGYLEESDGERILHDVEDFARRNTWAVAAGGLALGFVASRMLKASSSRRYESSYGSGRGYYEPSREGIGNGGSEAARSRFYQQGSSAAGAATGGATGTRESQFEPHR
jgi:hypothetical protein